MPQLIRTSRGSLRFAGIVLLAALMALASVGSPIAAAPPTRSVVLHEDDWRRAPWKPIAPSEIDALIGKELRASKIVAAPRTSDEQFIRRVSLDLTGQLPDPKTVASFVADNDPARRSRLIDQLLESDAYARHWARYWRDVVTARITNRRSMGLTRSFEEWLYEQLRADKNWGEIAWAILTAEGELRFSLNPPAAKGGAAFFLVAHDTDEAEERAAETSRVFLGIQIQCAQCHDHPSEPWKRVQFHELAAYFARIKYEQLFDDKKLVGVQLVTLPNREHNVTTQGNPEAAKLTHPRFFVDGQSPGKNLSDRERRAALADALIDRNNHWFAAAFVNRLWGELMGQSFYQNVDDLGPLKEVAFPEVLTTLTGAFRGTNYDIKALLRTIANSDAYQRQIRLGETLERDPCIASPCPTRLRPDALWDALVHVLGELQPGARFFTRGGVRFNTSFLEGRFKAAFDFDPSLRQDQVKGTIPQALFLMNNALLNKRILAQRTNVLGNILKDHPEDAAAIEMVYLHALARRPTERELAKCHAFIAAIEDRSEAYEDILWALINSTEFQTKR